MKTLIIYTSRHGCTESAVNILKENLQGESAAINLKKNKNFDLSAFDSVIVGGSIHVGKIQGRIKNFIKKNLDVLKQKKLGLFLCCMEEGEKAQAQFDSAYPEVLRNQAAATGLFGGEFNFDRMNFLEKFIIKKISGTAENISKIKEDRIRQFAAVMNRSK